MTPVFITGGTGYMGRRLIKKLVTQGYSITALVRPGSESKLPQGAKAVVANPFDASQFQAYIPKGAVFVQLLGVAHPSPRKKEQFRRIDLASVKASANAAAAAHVSHFIYVSVAMMETRVMQDFQKVRKEGENDLLSKGFPCTFIRPWYVLGPGHWWPLLLLPFYGIARLIPAWRQKAKALSLVTINQMIQTLVHTIDSAPQHLRLIEVSEIKRCK